MIFAVICRSRKMEAIASTASVNAEEDYDEYTPAKLIKTLEVSP